MTIPFREGEVGETAVFENAVYENAVYFPPVRKRVRPWMANTCLVICFILCMGSGAMVSLCSRSILTNSFRVVEGSGRASSYVSFWSDVDATTFRNTGNVLFIPLYTSSIVVNIDCVVTYDIKSAQLFAETFGKGNMSTIGEFALDVAKRLTGGGTIDTPAYSVKDVKCKATHSIDYLLVLYDMDRYSSHGIKTMTIARHVHSNVLYLDCDVQYMPASKMWKFIDKFMKNIRVAEVVDAIKSGILHSLETDTLNTPEYRIVNVTCADRRNLERLSADVPSNETTTEIDGQPDFLGVPRPVEVSKRGFQFKQQPRDTK